MPNQDDIRKLLGSIEIPSCPAVLAELMKEARKDDADLNRIASLVSRDVALSAGVLKIANSPMFGARTKTASIIQATSILGMRNLLGLVTTELLRSAFAKDAMPLARFWDNTVLTAQVCQRLCRRLGNADAPTAYLYGLFHDCGIPVLLRRFDNYRETLKAANFAPSRSFTTVEDEAIGTNHAVVGHLLARNWGLPAEVVEAILLHHEYEIFTNEREASTLACDLVAIGLIAERAIGIQQRLCEETEWDKGSVAMARYIGLSDTELADLLDDIGAEIAEIKDSD